MRNVDFSPFYRSTVGFDRLFSMLDQLATPEGVPVGGELDYLDEGTLAAALKSRTVF